CVSGLRYLVLELRIGDRPRVPGLALEVICDAVAQTVFDMPINTVIRCVELASGKPLIKRCITVIEDLREGFGPCDPVGLFFPESEPVLRRLRVGLSGQVSVYG